MAKKCRFPLVPSLILLTGIFACALSFTFSLQNSHFRMNLSHSLPNTLFLAKPIKSPVKKGQIVSIEHPVLNASIGKIIVGEPGDQISIQGQILFVNDFKIGEIKAISNSGKIYHPISEQEIPSGHYFVFTPHPESFDSRYQEFGLVKSEWIKEVLCPLF